MMFLPHERLRFTFQTFFSQNQFLLPEKCFSVVFRNVIVRGVVPSSFPQDHSTHFSCAQKKKSHSKPSELHGAFQCLHACQQPRVADAARRPGDPEGDRRRDDVFLHGHHASPRDGDGTSALRAAAAASGPVGRLVTSRWTLPRPSSGRSKRAVRVGTRTPVLVPPLPVLCVRISGNSGCVQVWLCRASSSSVPGGVVHLCGHPLLAPAGVDVCRQRGALVRS